MVEMWILAGLALIAFALNIAQGIERGRLKKEITELKKKQYYKYGTGMGH